VLVFAEHRHAQAQRTVDQQLLKPGQREGAAFQQLGRMTCACAADAQQALATLTQGLQATGLQEGAVRATPRDRTRGRLSQGAQPAQIIDTIEGALASSSASRPPLVDQQSGVIRATHGREETLLPPQDLWTGDTGQAHAERGCRCLNDPQFFASSRDRKKPEHVMAWLMVVTVCVLVYAALAYRIRQVLQDHDATFPNQQGKPVQNPTARWVFHDFVGIHVLRIPGQWDPVVVHLTEQHQSLLQLLGTSYIRFYRWIFMKMHEAVRNVRMIHVEHH
jgi:transposase